MNATKKITGVLASGLLVAGGGMALAAPLTEAIAAQPVPAAADQAAADVRAAASTVGEARVEGTFAFNQDAVSSNEAIRSVFLKAAATLCQSLPTYEVAASDGTIAISGPDGSSVATVGELAEEAGAASQIMGCSCASNLPGGGATVNAEVSGIPLSVLMEIGLA